MAYTDQEDGMGFSGLVPSKAERQCERRLAVIEQSERNEIKAELIRMRQYVMRKGLGIGECVAWCKIKERFGVGIRDADDEQWLKDYESRKSA